MNNPFTDIYDSGGWSNLGSGPGSSPRYNRKLLKLLNSFLKLRNVQSIVDYGCGDWQMFREFDFGGVRYLGTDVVEAVVLRNTELYARPGIEFRLSKSMKDNDIVGDLLFVKDVILHLPNKNCREILDHAKANFKYALFVNDMRSKEIPVNKDIEIGGYRPVDISRPPLLMPSTTLLVYGSDTRRVRNLKSLANLILGEKVQSGLKHVQLLD